MRENKIKEPIIFIVIEPNTKANYMNIFKALRSVYEKEPSFQVYTKYQTKYVIIAGVEEETLQIVVEALRREFNIEFKVGSTQIIYKQTIKNTIKSEGRYIKQSGGSSYGRCLIEIEPNERGTGYEFINKIYDDEVIPKEFIKSINSGIQESIKLGRCCGYSLTDIKVTLYDGSYHKSDSKQTSFWIAGYIAIREAIKDEVCTFLEPILKLVLESKDNKEDIIRLINSSSGKIEDGVTNGEIIVYIPLRETIGNSLVKLKNIVKGALSIDISHYEELIYEIQNNIVNEVDFYRCEYVDLLDFKTQEEEILNKIQSLKDIETNTLENNVSKYKSTQKELGDAYRKLAGIRNAEENLLNAINSYKEVIKLCEPTDRWTYLPTQIGMGKAFMNLAKLNDTENNILSAISVFKDVMRIEKVGGLHDSAYIDLGDAYIFLSKVQNKEENLLKAMDIFCEYLKACKSRKDYLDYKSNSMKYLSIKNRIGKIYIDLAEIKDGKKNLIKAIEIFNEALSIKKLECDSLEYAIAKNYIGIAHMKLSKLKTNMFTFGNDKIEENILKAIDAFNSALSIKTIKPEYCDDYVFSFEEEYPLKYAEIQNNLGKAYIDLAKLNNKKENLLKANESIDKAIWCYNEILKTKEEYSIDYEKIHNYINSNYALMKEID